MVAVKLWSNGKMFFLSKGKKILWRQKIIHLKKFQFSSFNSNITLRLYFFFYCLVWAYRFGFMPKLVSVPKNFIGFPNTNIINLKIKN